MFHNNPAYTLVKQVDQYRLYVPTQETEYSMIRHIEATKQATYAAAGANEEVIQAHLQAILDRCNAANSFDNFKTEITQIASALLYRTKYPVDQHCAVRMGCILSFLEHDEAGTTISEDPNKCDFVWQQKKEQLAFQHQDLYDFFLTWGATNVPQWSNRLDTLTEREYLLNRMTTLRSMLPKDLLSLSTR